VVFLGADQEAWMLTLMVDCLIFCYKHFVVCWMCKNPNLKMQNASMMRKVKCEAP